MLASKHAPSPYHSVHLSLTSFHASTWVRTAYGATTAAAAHAARTQAAAAAPEASSAEATACIPRVLSGRSRSISQRERSRPSLCYCYFGCLAPLLSAAVAAIRTCAYGWPPRTSRLPSATCFVAALRLVCSVAAAASARRHLNIQTRASAKSLTCIAACPLSFSTCVCMPCIVANTSSSRKRSRSNGAASWKRSPAAIAATWSSEHTAAVDGSTQTTAAGVSCMTRIPPDASVSTGASVFTHRGIGRILLHQRGAEEQWPSDNELLLDSKGSICSRSSGTGQTLQVTGISCSRHWGAGSSSVARNIPDLCERPVSLSSSSGAASGPAGSSSAESLCSCTGWEPSRYTTYTGHSRVRVDSSRSRTITVVGSNRSNSISQPPEKTSRPSSAVCGQHRRLSSHFTEPQSKGKSRAVYWSRKRLERPSSGWLWSSCYGACAASLLLPPRRCLSVLRHSPQRRATAFLSTVPASAAPRMSSDMCAMKPEVATLSSNGKSSSRSGHDDADAVKATSCSGPQVVFVLGGPGAGKGTQCELLTKRMNLVHISAGDCLREERSRPGSEHGELIDRYIKEGTIVPVEITLTLLLKKMLANGWNREFLIDGFPRNEDNLSGWKKFTNRKNLMLKLQQIRSGNPALASQCDLALQQLLQQQTQQQDQKEEAQERHENTRENTEGEQDINACSGVPVCFCLYLDCPEETLEQRLLLRGEKSQRSDDNAAAIRKRMVIYKQETLPIVHYLERQHKVRRVDASAPINDVWRAVAALFERQVPQCAAVQ